MKYVGYIVGGLVLLTVFSIAFSVIFYPMHTASNLVNTAYDAQDKVINADNAINNYEWFKQQKADIDASKKQLDIARRALTDFEEAAGDRGTWTFEDKTEDNRLRHVVLGLETNLTNQIEDYNARASMATRNIFEDRVLPSYIDTLTFINQ
jgi:hypothetical protein